MENQSQLELATTKKKFYGKSKKPSKSIKSAANQKPGKNLKKAKTLKKPQKPQVVSALKIKTPKIFSKIQGDSFTCEALSNARQSTLKKADSKNTPRPRVCNSFEQVKKPVKTEISKPRLIFKSRVADNLLKNLDLNQRHTPRPSPAEVFETPNSRNMKNFTHFSNISHKKTRPGCHLKRFSDKGIIRTLDTATDEYFSGKFNNCSFSTPKKFTSDSSFVVNRLDYSEVVQLEPEEKKVSPKKLSKAFSSPERNITYKSPDRWPGDKAPRKTLFGFESPDSFNFSISSSSFEYTQYEASDLLAHQNPDLKPTKDCEVQTDYFLLTPNTKIRLQ